MKKEPSQEELDAALNKLIKEQLKPLMSEDVCLIENGYLKVGPDILNSQQIKTLATECKLLREMRLWSIFQNTVRFEAFKMMSEANNMDAMRPGKWMLHNLNVLNGILENIISLSEKIPAPKKPPVSNPGA